MSLPEETKEYVMKIRQLISSLGVKKDTELTRIIGNMTLADLNRALYRCDQEERDEGSFVCTFINLVTYTAVNIQVTDLTFTTFQILDHWSTPVCKVLCRFWLLSDQVMTWDIRFVVIYVTETG